MEEDTGSDDGPRGRVALLEVGYRVRRVSGSLSVDYRGSAEPACRPLDACGLTGSRSLSLDGFRDSEDSRVEEVASLELTASRRLRGRRPSAARLLRDVRAGRLTGQVGFSLEGEAAGSARTERPGTPGCADAGRVELPPTGARLGREGLRLELAPYDSFADEDVVRSRCAGPTAAEVLGRTPLAVADVPAAMLGDRALRVVLGSSGAFETDAYAGERRGELVLELERIRLRASVLRPR